PGPAADGPRGLTAAELTAAWPDGCLVVRDATGVVLESDHARCTQPRRPHSTFKLANALVALDAGVLDGPDAPLTWDEKAIPSEPYYLESWRKPHTLRTGLAVSSVPHFRTLARTLGDARMRAGLAKLGYGNQDLTGGLDLFWLEGGLRISATEQLALVEGIARGTLKVSARAQEVVREITELARSGDAVLHGKTGSGRVEDGTKTWLVWQVGWITRGDTIVPYAAWMEVAGDRPWAEARGARDVRLTAALTSLFQFTARDARP
ncbi:MAG: class D beta-lactamase, partial [Deltaproteobacteria bacterium]|nr:class D beta-lactamase [Deltaproteobacteria bacterium]